MSQVNSISKCLARSMVTAVCRLSTVLGRAEVRLADRLSILCYHRVLPAERKAAYFLPDLVVTPESFRQHCQMLRSRFDVRTLHGCYTRLSEGRFSVKPLAAITFDDGYRDNLDFAAPILREFGLPATFFVITGLVGSTNQPWYDRLGQAVSTSGTSMNRGDLVDTLHRFGLNEQLDRADNQFAISPQGVVALAKGLPTDRRTQLVEATCQLGEHSVEPPPEDLIMDWGHLSQLQDAGHEIGSHSESHEILTLLDDDRLASEVVGSKQTLESGIGAVVRSFCYPNGDFDGRVARAVERAGYVCAATTEEGDNEASVNRFTLQRRFVHEGRLTGFPRGLSSHLLRMEMCGLTDRLYGRQNQPLK